MLQSLKRDLWILIEVCHISRYHKYLRYNTLCIPAVLTHTFTSHVSEQVPQFICFCWRFYTTNKNCGRAVNCQRWQMGSGQMGTYMSQYNVIICIQQCLCSMYSEAARLILENNDTKLNVTNWFGSYESQTFFPN